MNQVMPEFLTTEGVARLLKIDRHRVWPLVRAGMIPPPLVLGARSARWRVSDFEPKEAKAKAKKNPFDRLLGLDG